MTTIRRSLGPEFTSMICLGCGSPTLHGLIDKNGRPYVSCESCRVRFLGLSLRVCASLRFFGALLRDRTVREGWLTACHSAEADSMKPLGTTPTAAPAPTEVSGGR